MAELEPVQETRLSDNELELYNLILKIADDDQSSLNNFYDKTIKLVFSLAFRVVRDESEAEEVSHDVYMSVWKNAHKYDPKRSKPLTWLLVITRSKAIDRLRTMKNSSVLDDSLEEKLASENENPENLFEFNQKKEMIMKAMSNLNTRQRKVIELSFFYGLTHREISEEVDIPVGSVKSSVRLAMVKLKRELNVAYGS